MVIIAVQHPCSRKFGLGPSLSRYTRAADALVRPLKIPDPLRPNSGHTGKTSKSAAGGLNRLSLLLFGLGIVLVVDSQRLLAYNIKQHGMSHRFPQKSCLGIKMSA